MLKSIIFVVGVVMVLAQVAILFFFLATIKQQIISYKTFHMLISLG